MSEAATTPPYQLFQRAGSSKWWVRFSIRGQGQIRKALGTADRTEAERLAQEVWYEARYRAKNGLTATVRTFEQVAEEFIAQIEREAARGERAALHARQYPAIIRRYFVGFFGQKPIDAISDKDVVRYLEWRKDYWITGPGKAITHIDYERNGRRVRRPIGEERKPPTLSRQRGEAVLLRMLFRQAAKWGYIKNIQIPEVSVPRVPPNARPSFDAFEFEKLVAESLGRLADPAVNPHVRRDRTILHAYIMIAAFTGMRPTEMRNLNWGDVLGYRGGRERPLSERDIRLRVRGKGKSRTFVPLEAALPWFDTLWMLWKNDRGCEPTDTDPVFATPEGKRLSSLKKGLAELLKHCGLLTDHRGVRRTSYSFRHFYISQQIIHGVDVFILAKNTGTSPEMIDRFYADVKLERMKEQLRPEWRRR